LSEALIIPGGFLSWPATRVLSSARSWSSLDSSRPAMAHDNVVGAWAVR
jgi:hypothetical protein